jgi:hypothetical protein
MFLVGDLITTTSNPDPSQFAPPLPSRFQAGQVAPSRNIVGLKQKVICLKPRLAAAWAGPTMLAEQLLARVRDLIGDEYTGEHVLDILDSAGYSQTTLNEIAFIFYMFDNDGRVRVQGHNIGTYTDPAMPARRYMFAGSGKTHFLEMLSSKFFPNGNWDELSKDLAVVFNRAALAFHEEITSDITHFYRYGGGFEVLAPDIIEKKMTKIPYSCAYWAFSDVDFGFTGPLVSYQYHNNGVLQIDRLATEEGRLVHHAFLVGNFFADPGAVSPLSPKVPLGPLVHYILDGRGETETLSGVVELWQTTFSIAASDGGWNLNLDRESTGFQLVEKSVDALRKRAI